MKKIFQWIVYSSSDPSKVSLTLKGVGTMLIGIIVPIIGLTHLSIGGDPTTVLNSVLDTVMTISNVVLTLIGALIGAYGLVRKIYLSLTGQNQAV